MGTIINILPALSKLSACKRWVLYLHPVAVNAWGWEIQKVQRRGERVSVMLSKGGWGGEGELKEEGRRQREGHGKGEREGSGQWLIGVLELQKWQDPRIMCEWKAERLRCSCCCATKSHKKLRKGDRSVFTVVQVRPKHDFFPFSRKQYMVKNDIQPKQNTW